MTLRVEVAIEAEGWAGVVPIVDEIGAWATAAAREGGLDAEDEAEVAVLLCDDAAIRALNGRWRGKDAPTNVLSFPAAGPPPPRGPRPLGDIAVAFETSAREARDGGKPLRAHLAHLVVHGTLHLLGHDHHDPAPAEAMEAAERRILLRLGFDDPYAGTEPATTKDR